MHLNLHALGFALLLGALAACGSEPETRAPSTTQESSIVAVVNSEPIYFEDIELEAVAQGQIEPGTEFTTAHPEYYQVLDQLIDQRLLAQEALNRGLDQDPTARRRLESGRERLLGNILVESLVANEVTEAAIDRMYEEQVKLQQLDDEVRLRMILVGSKLEAEQIVSDINDGQTFTDAALQHSQDARTRLDGGDLGWIRPNEMLDPLPAVIGNTETGALSDVFETERGWNILKVDERRTTPPKTKVEMRPEIITFLTFTQISDILRELRVKADIQMADAAESSDQAGASDSSEDTE